MPTTYTTKPNDRLDKVAAQFFGVGNDPTRSPGRFVELLIEANPGVEQQSFLLTPGTVLTIPTIANAVATVQTLKRVNLWD